MTKCQLKMSKKYAKTAILSVIHNPTNLQYTSHIQKIFNKSIPLPQYLLYAKNIHKIRDSRIANFPIESEYN